MNYLRDLKRSQIPGRSDMNLKVQHLLLYVDKHGRCSCFLEEKKCKQKKGCGFAFFFF